MFALNRGKTNEIYSKCLKSMLKYDIILKHFMSSDSKNVNDNLNFLPKKSIANIEKRKSQMKIAEKVFDLIKGDDELKNYEAKEKVSSENLSSKIIELMKTAEAIPETSSDTVKITKAKSTPRKGLKVQEDTKKQFLEKAKEVAIALGVDVEETQQELLEAFENKKVNVKAPQKDFGKIHKIQYPDSRGTKSHFSMKDTPVFNIFKKHVREEETRPTLETWNQLKKITLLHASFRPPRNYFEELINWTHQGKLWHFPIDNDQDWKEELATDFTEHVFLDKHLESWCPKSGPIRHFMELVTTGLSKNPYLSVEKKKQHLFWYKDYFQSKTSLLAELGVLDCTINTDAEKLEAGENKS